MTEVSAPFAIESMPPCPGWCALPAAHDTAEYREEGHRAHRPDQSWSDFVLLWDEECGWYFEMCTDDVHDADAAVVAVRLQELADSLATAATWLKTVAS